MRSPHWAGVHQAARSTSGNVPTRPEPRGHSISKVPGTTSSTSRSPSSAQTLTTLPFFWTTSPIGSNGPVGTGSPSSSANSRRAVDSRSSPGSGSPLGTVQAPLSRLAKNGPPMWASSTRSESASRRYSRIPALRRAGAGTSGGALGVGGHVLVVAVGPWLPRQCRHRLHHRVGDLAPGPAGGQVGVVLRPHRRPEGDPHPAQPRDGRPDRLDPVGAHQPDR